MFHFKWLPPGRGIANMGADFVIDEWDSTPLQNCGFVSTDVDFADAMHFLMLASMNGVGIGFDVAGAEKHFVKQREGETITIQIPDTREGWAEALRSLIESYLNGTAPLEFDYTLIRPAGSLIARFGGTASGPESLKTLLDDLDALFTQRVGNALTVTDIADIGNKIGCCVVSGSARRSAELLLGPQTEEYMDLKNYGKEVDGEWVEGPGSARSDWSWMSNNSVHVSVGQDYRSAAERTILNGEPGYVWMDTTRGFGRMKDSRDNKDYRAAGYNPCAEQSLESYELCTLAETYPTRAENHKDYLKTLKVAYLYAKTVTLVPTVFERSNAVMMRNRRIGLSQTGITTYVETHGISKWRELSDDGYNEVQRLDTVYSDWLCVRNSIRNTTVKPSGSVSLLTGDSPGVHWNPAAGFYIRRMTMAPSVLLDSLREAGYTVEPSFYSKGQFVVEFPIESPFIRSEKDVSIWEKVALAAEAQHWWSDNSVSVTVSYDRETEGVHIPSILSLYEGRMKTLSFFPMDKDTYKQMPYEEITEAEYRKACAKLRPLNRETVYNVGEEALGEKYCTNDVCEIPVLK
jgi:adenosylcobalamin-dependent ribonucleoside-triphosphate reductase